MCCQYRICQVEYSPVYQRLSSSGTAYFLSIDSLTELQHLHLVFFWRGHNLVCAGWQNSFVNWQTCTFKRNLDFLVLIGSWGLLSFIESYAHWQTASCICGGWAAFVSYQVFIMCGLWYLFPGSVAWDCGLGFGYETLHLRILTFHGYLLFRSIGKLFIYSCEFSKKKECGGVLQSFRREWSL